MLNRMDISTRRAEARRIRQEAADAADGRPRPDHLNNGEEEAYRNPQGKLSYIANHAKGLRHNRFGEVVPDAYRQMVRAMYSGAPGHFEAPQMMGVLNGLNLTNPQAGLAFDLEGPDAQAVTMPPAPRIDGPENSAEMGEVYWMALCRDVHFRDYGTGSATDDDGTGVGPHSLTIAAAQSLSPTGVGSEFSRFTGPMVNGAVTAAVTPGPPPTQATLFRGFAPGDLVGPYVSQFLLKGTADPVLNPPPDKGVIGYGTLGIDQRQKTAQAGINFLTVFGPPPLPALPPPNWLDVQRGRRVFFQAGAPFDVIGSDVFDPTPRFIRNLRDLATYVHFDALYEAYVNACLLLLNMPARVDPGNPYVDMPPMMNVTQRTQDGFATFGAPHILTLVAEVATRALKAVWFQKWGVHRRLRPEEFGGRIHVHRNGIDAMATGQNRYAGVIDGEILGSAVLGRIEAANPTGSTLLPLAFPEGCPTHPAYGAGHATVGGACVTILKAWFDESEVFDPNVVTVSPPNPALEALLRENRTPKVPNRQNEPNPGDAAGTLLLNYAPPDKPANEPPLTVGGELNKLAANIALGRNAAGVHWRSDYTQSLFLGEEIAIRLLQEQKLTYNEDHHLSLTKFDGTTVII